MLEFDKKYFSKYNIIAGLDEAGRGPLAGPVVAAAVVFDKNVFINGINDSKKISAKKRETLFDEIISNASYIGVGIVQAKEIDEINILEATKKAMEKSIKNLKIIPELVLVDGNQIEFSEYNQVSIIKGDTKSFSIASASIIAKVTRDRIMEDYSKILPEYGFESHKGYGTKQHFQAISDFKSSIIHRKSFNPVSNHLPSFNYYTDNNILDRLLIQIAGDYLIQKHHKILDVNKLCIHSTLKTIEYISYIESNISNQKLFNKSKINKNFNNQLIEIDFNQGFHNIVVNSI